VEVEIVPSSVHSRQQQQNKQLLTRIAAMERTKALPLKRLLEALDRRGVRYSIIDGAHYVLG